MSTRIRHAKAERNPSDYRTLTEALHQAHADSGQTQDTTAEHLGVRRSYLADALSVGRAEVLQFQARHLVPFMRLTGSALPLEWMAAQLGYVLVPCEHATQAADVASEILDVQKHAGELAGRFLQAQRDGRLCGVDRADLKEFARRVQREAAEVELAVEGLPSHVEVRR